MLFPILVKQYTCSYVVVMQKEQYETCVLRAVLSMQILLSDATKQHTCTSHPSIHIYTYLHTQSRLQELCVCISYCMLTTIVYNMFFHQMRYKRRDYSIQVSLKGKDISKANTKVSTYIHVYRHCVISLVCKNL